MKRWLSFFLCLTLVVGLVPAAIGVQATTTEMEDETLVIENAGFEETGTDSIPGWALLSGVIMPSGELSITKDEHRSGNSSLSITPISTFTDTKTSVVYSGGILGMRDGLTYTASAYFKGDLAPSIGLRFYNMYSVEMTTATVKATGTVSGDWTKLTVSATMPSGALFARVMLEGYGDGTLYVDDVEIVENPVPDGQAKPTAYGTQVPDGSFEEVAAGKDSAWTLEQEGSGKWMLGSSEEKCGMENYVSGDLQALRLTSYVPGPSGETVSFYSAPIPVTPGETYTYSLRIRTSKTDLAYSYAYLMFYSSTSVAAGDRLGYTDTATRANINWGALSKSMAAPAGAVYARVCVQIPKHNWWTGDGYGDSRWVDIDDVVVTDSTGAVLFEEDGTEQVNGAKAALQATDTTTEFATDGAVSVKMGAGKLVSGNIPILQGKEYTALVDVNCGVENSVALIAEYCNQKGVTLKTYTTANKTVGTKETLRITQIAPDNTVYVKLSVLVTTGTSYVDNVQFYALSDSISNFSFEQVNAYAGSGNFPMQWRVTGDVDAWAVSSPANNMPNRTMGLKMVGLGNGSVYSSMMKATAGESYIARIQASSVQGGGMRLVFFDQDFKQLATGNTAAFGGKAWARYAATATAPANTAYVAIELVAAKDDVFRVDAAEFSTTVLNIGDDTQMFLDDYVLASTSGFDRVFHQGVDGGVVMDQSDNAGPWEKNGPYVYGTVFYDEEEQIFKMWYLGHNLMDASSYGGISWYTCYATSPDGVNWTKPNLGLVEYGGNKDNNIVNTVHLASVFKQSKEDEPDDAKRYIMIYQDFELLEQNGGSAPTYSYAYSADGIHWGKGTTFTPGWDVITAGWDDDNKQFITLQKVNIHGRRDQHFMTGTPDEWSVPLDAAALADIQDTLESYRADTYGTGFYIKDGNYVAIEWLLSIPGGADTNVTHVMDGTKDLRLGYSRDLTEDWQRPTLDPIIPRGTKEDIRYSIGTVAYAIDVGDEIWMYSYGCDTDHGGELVWDPVNEKYTTYYGNRKMEIFIAKWRADGFASLNAGNAGGVMTTKPLVFSGDKLLLNANAADGAVRVELLDANGNVISGYSKDDCDVINTDSVKHVVSWNGQNDLSDLEGEAVTMRVYAENSEIYSFKFSDTVPGSTKPVQAQTETKLQYEAVDMEQAGSGYVRFGNTASDYKLFMTSDGAHYDQTATNSKDAIIHRFTAPQDGTIYIDTAFTTDGTANDCGIHMGNADWQDPYPAKYAIVDQNGKIVFPRDGQLGTISYFNPAGIPQSDPVAIDVKAGDHIDFVLIDTFGGGIPMFFEARIFMNRVGNDTYIGGPDGALTGANFNQQGEGGWRYMYAQTAEMVTNTTVIKSGDVQGEGKLTFTVGNTEKADSVAAIRSGAVVTVHATPSENHMLVPGSLSYTTASGKTVKILNKSLTSQSFGEGDGYTYQFVMPEEAVTVNAEFRDATATSFVFDTIASAYHKSNGSYDGLRFLMRVGFDKFDPSKNEITVTYNGKSYTVAKMGMLLKRATNGAELTLANFADASVNTASARIWNAVSYDKSQSSSMSVVDYTGSYVDVQVRMMKGDSTAEATFKTRQYTARGYIVLEDATGAQTLLYTDTTLTRSVADCLG